MSLWGGIFFYYEYIFLKFNFYELILLYKDMCILKYLFFIKGFLCLMYVLKNSFIICYIMGVNEFNRICLFIN